MLPIQVPAQMADWRGAAVRREGRTGGVRGVNVGLAGAATAHLVNAVQGSGVRGADVGADGGAGGGEADEGVEGGHRLRQLRDLHSARDGEAGSSADAHDGGDLGVGARVHAQGAERGRDACSRGAGGGGECRGQVVRRRGGRAPPPMPIMPMALPMRAVLWEERPAMPPMQKSEEASRVICVAPGKPAAWAAT